MSTPEANEAREAMHAELTRLRAEVETLTDSNAAKADRLDRLGETVVKMRAEVETLADNAAIEIKRMRTENAWMRTENAWLEDEAEALRADAERYRYLRSRQAIEVLTGRGPSAGVWCDMENEMGTLVLATGDDLDAEVDAARATLKEKTNG